MTEQVVDAHSDDDGSRRVEGKFIVLEDDNDDDNANALTIHLPYYLSSSPITDRISSNFGTITCNNFMYFLHYVFICEDNRDLQ